MTLSITTDDLQYSAKRIHLQGRLDSDTAPLLDQRLDTLLQGDIQRLIFDMKDLSYISSAGLSRETMAPRIFCSDGIDMFFLQEFHFEAI